MSWKNVARNEHRVRKKSGRARKNALNGMTEQISTVREGSGLLAEMLI